MAYSLLFPTTLDAPWCGWCSKAKPEVAKAADKLSDRRGAWRELVPDRLGQSSQADVKYFPLPLTVSIAGVDCTESPDLCSKYEVKSYPTFKLFSGAKSQPEDYQVGVVGGGTQCDPGPLPWTAY